MDYIIDGTQLFGEKDSQLVQVSPDILVKLTLDLWSMNSESAYTVAVWSFVVRPSTRRSQ